MAGEIGDYTTTIKVRAIAGVTDNEVDDDTLLSMELDQALLADLYPWIPGHKALWEGGADDATPPANDDQKQIRRLILYYAGRFCALALLGSSMHLPQQKSNGKDTAKRFSDDALEIAKMELRQQLDNTRRQLLELIEPSTASSGSGLFAVASPDADPVTNS